MTFTITNELLKPAQYVQARYRCENQIGFSGFSEIVYMLMAGVPTAPSKPT